MLFAFEEFCLPALSFEAAGEDEAVLGGEGLLTVALVMGGRCSALEADGDGAAIAAAGGILLAAGSLRVLPIGSCHIVGTGLVGAAPQALAATLNGTLLLDSAACPGAGELITSLAQEGETPLPPASTSVLAYTLVATLAAAQPAGKPLPPLVGAAIASIHENYAEVYGVEELAKALDVSKSHLVRSFSAATGTTPGQFLTQVRLDAAKRLLLNPAYPLEVVASLCGFSGANYLCKVFRKHTGETPAAYRTRMAGTAPPASTGEWEDMLFL